MKIPQLIETDDYHKFANIQETLQILDLDIRCIECGVISRFPPSLTYLGIVNISGKKPSKAQMRKMTKTNDTKGGTIEFD